MWGCLTGRRCGRRARLAVRCPGQFPLPLMPCSGVGGVSHGTPARARRYDCEATAQVWSNCAVRTPSPPLDRLLVRLVGRNGSSSRPPDSVRGFAHLHRTLRWQSSDGLCELSVRACVCCGYRVFNKTFRQSNQDAHFTHVPAQLRWIAFGAGACAGGGGWSRCVSSAFCDLSRTSRF